MSFAAGGAVLFVLVFSVGAAVVLYLFVTAEHDDRDVMDRESAEQSARKDRNE